MEQSSKSLWYVPLMSSKRKRDYKKVFKVIKKLLPNTKVKKMVADFQSSIWQGFLSVCPNADVQGCVFYWTQAIWRKMGELGLQKPYQSKKPLYCFCRKLMALPFLPHENINGAFQKLRNLYDGYEGLTRLCSYINRQWMTNQLFTPPRWSIFMQPMQTNNDVEGWLKRMNSATCKPMVPMYLLIQFLQTEAKFVKHQVQMIF